MVMEKLGSSLKSTLSKIARSMFVDEKLIDELIKDIQRALLQADVNVKLVFELTKRIKDKALNEKPPTGMTQKEFLVKIVYDELTAFLGGEKNEVVINKKPFRIMLVGLFGSGKTTTSAKVAKFFSKRGIKVALVQTDTWRPAACHQLKTLGKQVNVPVFGDEKEKNPLKIIKKYEPEFKKYDIIIIDTAGRDALSKELIKEIEKINSAVKPNEVLLVISADIGQAAQSQAQQFHESCNITGVIPTKMDGTAKAGGALSACAVTSAPIKFIGTGEKVDDLEQFNPQGFVGRMLGMGDIEALLEKAKSAMSEEKAEDMGRKLLKGEFNFIDLYEQMQAMSKMGSFSKLVDLIPGMGNLNIPKDMLKGQEHKLKIWKHIMQSMTKEELENPSIITAGRVERIAKGSGVSIKEVRELLKQYRMAKKMLKMMKASDTSDMNSMMKKLKGRMPKGFR